MILVSNSLARLDHWNETINGHFQWLLGPLAWGHATEQIMFRYINDDNRLACRRVHKQFTLFYGDYANMNAIPYKQACMYMYARRVGAIAFINVLAIELKKHGAHSNA